MRKGEVAADRNLGTVFHLLCEYENAKEYMEKALAMWSEIGDRKGEAAGDGKLETFFLSRNENGKAEEYTEKALAITKEISDRKGQTDDYGS